MEENQTSGNDSISHFNDELCVNCQQNRFEPGKPINLCTDCRKSLIAYPIPKSIIYFAIALAVIIGVSLVRTQRYVSAAIHLGKAENAIERKEFLTAQNELLAVLNAFPDHMTANAYMMIASAYNFDFEAYGVAYERIADKTTEDDELLQQVNTASSYIAHNFPNDTVFYKKILAYPNDEQKLIALADSTDELPLKGQVANRLYDLKAYSAAQAITDSILIVDPNFYQAISMKSAIKRNLGKCKDALALCDRLLQFNSQDVYAISQKARIELKCKNDKAAAQYADKAMNLSPYNPNAMEAKAMVEYFSGNKKQSLITLAQIKEQERKTGDSTVSTRLSPIINGLEVYR